MALPVIESKYGYRSTAIEVVEDIDLSGKVAFVTGASNGLGLETARALAHAKAHVFLAVRDVARGEEAAKDIKESTKNDKVEVIHLDLSNFAAVRKCAEEFLQRDLPLSILINNAGIMACPFTKTVDGFESQFATNHLAHFLLTNLLVPSLIRGAPSRVVSVSSCAHLRHSVLLDDVNFETTPYNEWVSYAQSKTANIWFASELDRRLKGTGVSAFSLHPGGILTGLQKFVTKEWMQQQGWMDADGNPNPRFKTQQQGASTSVWAATSPALNGHGGLYLEDCNVSKPTALPMTGFAPHAYDSDGASRLWTISEKAVGQSFRWNESS